MYIFIKGNLNLEEAYFYMLGGPNDRNEPFLSVPDPDLDPDTDPRPTGHVIVRRN